MAEGKQSVNRSRLRGTDKEKYQLFDAISKAVGQSSTWKGLEEKLGRQGISVQYKYKSGTTEVQGVSFSKGGSGKERTATVSFKGSELDRSLSYGNISKELARNRQALGLEPLSVSGTDRNKEGSSSLSSIPALSPAENIGPGEPNSGKTAYQGTGNGTTTYQRNYLNQTAAQETDNSKTASQETESVEPTAARTAGHLVTSLLSGLSFSSGEDQDDEQHKKKKKQSYKR